MLSRIIASVCCVIAIMLTLAGLGRLTGTSSYGSIELNDLTRSMQSMQRGEGANTMRPERILAESLHGDIFALALVGAGIVAGVIAIGALQIAKPTTRAVSEPISQQPQRTRSRSSHIDVDAATPPAGTPPVMPPETMRPGESEAAWAKRIEAEDVARFKSRSKKP